MRLNLLLSCRQRLQNAEGCSCCRFLATITINSQLNEAKLTSFMSTKITERCMLQLLQILATITINSQLNEAKLISFMSTKITER
ncbi:hypothetical protein CEXT_253541 [Caerostris extrusa]|uniref:Uncharacterized protein n=1 Tax=Caerostris extrusa TaxID=172846 RepID=A0AAV4SW19_CAEEX|nr:hypothetical protein CEXT_253541 [Caerostris extrusa]